MTTLTHYESNFLTALMKDMNRGAAVKTAGYRGESPMEESLRLLALPRVQDELNRRLQPGPPDPNSPAAKQQQVLDQLSAIANANPLDLIRQTTGCCRCCWGQGFDYQRTPREHRLHLAAGGAHEGGPGYNKLRPPNPGCPECFGEGITHTQLADVSTLNPALLSLCRSIEVTASGVQLRLYSKLRALELTGKALGLFKHKKPPTMSEDERRLQAAAHIQAANEYAEREAQKVAAMSPQERADYEQTQDPSSIALNQARMHTLPKASQPPSPHLDDPETRRIQEWLTKKLRDTPS